jgi:hypothetical protein
VMNVEYGSGNKIGGAVMRFHVHGKNPSLSQVQRDRVTCLSGLLGL